MSIQSKKREDAIYSEFDAVVKQSSKAVSELLKQTALVKLFVVFLHDNIVNGKGDIVESDRTDLRDALVPLYPQLKDNLAQLTAIFEIHDDDPVVWEANLNSYLAANPLILDEAINRFPTAS